MPHSLSTVRLRFPKALLRAVLAVAFLTLGPPRLQAQLLDTIFTGGQNEQESIAFNPLTNTIYVANGDGTVTVIDGASNSSQSLTAGTLPVAIAVNPTTNTVYVVNQTSNNVTVIDGLTNAIVATLPTQTSPSGVAINPVTNQIYVANLVSGSVTVLDGNTNTVAATITVGSNPSSVAVNPATNQVYVATSDGLAQIDGATNAATPIILSSVPSQIAINPASDIIYIASSGSSTLTAVNVAAGTQASIILGEGSTNISAIAVNPVTNQIFAADQANSAVYVIEGATGAVFTVSVGNSPTSLTLNAATNQVYVGSSADGSVSTVNGYADSLSAITLIPSPGSSGQPNLVAVNPITNLIYAVTTTTNGGTVSVATGATNAVSTLHTGNGPNAIVVNPVSGKILIPSQNDDLLTVIDGAGGPATQLALPLNPGPTAVDSVTNVVYSGDEDASILVTNLSTGATTVLQGEAPQLSVAVNEVTNMVYFGNNDGSVDIVNGQTQIITNILSGGTSANAIAVNEATNTIYVVDTAASRVFTINGVTNAASSIAVGSEPEGIAINPVTNQIYVTNSGANTVTVINGGFNDSAHTQTISVGSIPDAVAVNPLTNTIYVGNAAGHSVSVIDGSSNTVTTTVSSAGIPGAIAVDPATNHVYVANQNIGFLNVIDGATNIVSTVIADSPSSALVVNPRTGFAYALSNNSNTVEVLAPAPAAASRLATAIAPIPSNMTTEEVTTIGLSATSVYGPIAQPITGIYYQLDGVTGPWLPALPGSSSSLGTASFAGLSPGLHTLYAFAVDGLEAPSINAGAGASLIPGQLAAYTFLASPSYFSFSAASVLAHSSASSITVTVQRNFADAATVDYQTFDGTALAGTNYISTHGTLTFAPGQTTQTVAIPLISQELAQNTVSFSIQLSTPSGTSAIGSPGSLSVIIVNDSSAEIGISVLNPTAPANPGPATASITVTLNPAVGQWRLFGQLYWQDSENTITGLTAGNYEIEFQTADGFIAPSIEVVSLAAGQAAMLTGYYYATTNAQPEGYLTVNLAPASTGGWQLSGDPPGVYHQSGDLVSNLISGSYIVAFEPVPGYSTPPNCEVFVGGNALTTLPITYLIAPTPSPTSAVPSLVDGSLAQSAAPYKFLGQIQTDNGLGTGFVPLDHVVVTAAHVVFDDETLTYVTGVRWFFQQDTGVFESPAEIPLGFYVFSGYAAQRAAEATPGVSSPLSQQLDVAALTFLAPTARGGQSGYLASNSSANSWLTGSRNKLLTGYPVDASFIPPTSVGQLYATPFFQSALAFVSGSLFETTAITSYGGNSGGPLCVQFDDGVYYPAAIYLGGTQETVVRSIDSEVIELMNRAEVSGSGGTPGPSDGDVFVDAGLSGTTALVLGSVNVTLDPPGAVTAGAQWELGDNIPRGSGQTDAGLTPGSYTITFSDVPGYATPSPQTVTVTQSQTTAATAAYTPNVVPTITSPLTVFATEELIFHYQIAASFNPTSFSIASGSLPTGLTLDTSNGLISGVPTAAGVFPVHLQATNVAGPSAQVILTLTVAPLGQLSVAISPAQAGSVPKRFSGTSIQSVGSSLTIPATPGAGYLFDHWSNAETGAVLTTTPSYSFTMPAAFALQANFVANPFLSAKGSYFALIQGGTYAGSGALQLTVASLGSFTASLTLGGAAAKVHSSFNDQGRFLGEIFLSDHRLFNVTLSLTAGGSLTGTLINVNDASQLTLASALPAAASESLVGPYTAQLPLASADPSLPAGNGYGTLLIAKGGSVTFSGFLGDGTPVHLASSLVHGNSWAFYFTKAQNKTTGTELVLGTLTPTVSPAGFTGTLDWFREPSPTASLYKTGFAAEIAFDAGAYKAPAVSSGAATVTLSGGNLSAPLVVPIDISTKDIVTAPGGPAGFSLKFTAATGLFTGSFLEGTAKRTFNGALLQFQSNGQGLFQEATGLTGSVLLQSQ